MRYLFSAIIFFLVATTAPAPFLAQAEDRAAFPDAQDVLRVIRNAQTAQEIRMTGDLQTGARKHPFKLSLSKGVVRYDFTDTPSSLILHFGENSSRLEEEQQGKTQTVPPERYTEKVRDTDLRYEDLSLRFLYWSNAKVIGEAVVTANGCWKVEVKPTAADRSQYSRVVLYVGKDDASLMKAEAYGLKGEFARRFQVVSGMRRKGLWFLKEMRIEAFDTKFGDRTPTYLRIHEILD